MQMKNLKYAEFTNVEELKSFSKGVLSNKITALRVGECLLLKKKKIKRMSM